VGWTKGRLKGKPSKCRGFQYLLTTKNKKKGGRGEKKEKKKETATLGDRLQ